MHHFSASMIACDSGLPALARATVDSFIFAIRDVDQDIRLTDNQWNAIRFVSLESCHGHARSVVGLQKRVEKLELALDDILSWVSEAPLIVPVRFEKKLRDGSLQIDAMANDDRLRNTEDEAECAPRMFGGAYHDAPPCEYPIFGTWMNACKHLDSSYFVLKNSVHWRTTLADRDRCDPDAKIGHGANIAHVLETFHDDELFAMSNQTWEHHLSWAPETHVHGGVLFGRDVAKVVLDDSLDPAVKAKVCKFCLEKGLEMEMWMVEKDAVGEDVASTAEPEETATPASPEEANSPQTETATPASPEEANRPQTELTEIKKLVPEEPTKYVSVAKCTKCGNVFYGEEQFCKECGTKRKRCERTSIA